MKVFVKRSTKNFGIDIHDTNSGRENVASQQISHAYMLR